MPDGALSHTHTNLADLYTRLLSPRYDKAIEHLTIALTISKKAQGERHIDVAWYSVTVVLLDNSTIVALLNNSRTL